MPGTGTCPEAVVSPVDGAEMVCVPAGDFTMGISQEELYHIFMLQDRENPAFATEVPAQNVYLEDYYIDRYPVTNFQYRKFIEATGHRAPMLIDHPDWGQPLQPVVFVGWMMPGPMPGGPVKNFPRKRNGKRPAAVPTVAGGPGATNFCRTDAIPGNMISRTHRRLLFLTKGSAPADVMTCAAMYGRCVKASGWKGICPCGAGAF